VSEAETSKTVIVAPWYSMLIEILQFDFLAFSTFNPPNGYKTKTAYRVTRLSKAFPLRDTIGRFLKAGLVVDI
jgi:hypothetical protein